MDPRVTKLADLLVNYSCEVKKGQKLLFEMVGFDPFDLGHEVTRIATRKGAHVFVNIRHDRLQRRFLLDATEEQIKAQAKYDLHRMRDMDCYIGVRGSANTMELGDVPSAKQKLWMKHYVTPVHFKTRVAKTRWVVLRYPNDAMAQNAHKSLHAFEDFYFDVCTLDYRKMSKAMDPLKKRMDSTDQVEIKAPGTDLSFSIKGLPAVKCDGKLNIPDGECYSAPVKKSINGTIRFNAAALYEGTVFDEINLRFKNGKVVDADAGAQTKKLEEVLDHDTGSRYVGEFALGFNPHVTEPMLDALFDEKIAGSLHMALGNAYDDCDNGNRSSIHWDIVHIQRPERGGGEIYFDGELIRKDGLFVPKELQGLNPDRLV
ncbi:MAG: aminopeptidase [Candidatus Eisenbacteria bacterium]|nr:aminopeptidase [Candidatus Latescibacterota bacterium]MBD3303046.1 aminopeptidase [Candidatus Eisenbacteria bacterium]